VFEVGAFEDGELHVIDTPNGALAARLTIIDETYIYVESLHSGYPSIPRSMRKSLTILGRIVETYPTGDLDVRWIVEDRRQAVAFSEVRELLVSSW
jgi:hypothetical protein